MLQFSKNFLGIHVCLCHFLAVNKLLEVNELPRYEPMLYSTKIRLILDEIIETYFMLYQVIGIRVPKPRESQIKLK